MKFVSRRTSSKKTMPGFSLSRLCARACMVCGVLLMVWPFIASPGDGRDSLSSRNASNPSVLSSSPPGRQDDLSPPSPPLPSIIGDSPGAGRQGRTASARPDAPGQKAERAARSEILRLYRKWMAAWQTKDIETVMGLCSSRLRFRNISGKLYDYNGFREWLWQLWQAGAYRAEDLHPPELVIVGDHATLEADQSYGEAEQNGPYYRSRYVWERQARPSGARWLIIEHVYLPYRSGENGDEGRMTYSD